jgi:hypothetical protein
MDIEQKEKVGYTAEYIVGGGYLLFFCLASIFCLAFYYFTIAQQRSVPIPVNTFATSLPPTTPTPHISFVDQSKFNTIFEDDFSTDQNHWTFHNDGYKEEVREEKLHFESRIKGNYAYTGCRSCPYFGKPFYLQAYLTTAKATDESFGIVFNLDRSTEVFYLFEVNTEAKKYYLYHHTDSGWSLLAAGESNHIRSFPDGNTIGIYANQDTAEFYINDKIIDSYKQSGAAFQSGYFAFYVNDAGFSLSVDNVTIREVGKK